MSAPHSLADLIGAPVRVDTIRVGKVVGVFLDTRWERVIGLEVSSTGGARRFLPWVAADIAPDAVHIESALLLVDDNYERLGAMSVHERVHLDRLGGSEDGTVCVEVGDVTTAVYAGMQVA